MYLRFHYFVDLLAGAVVALLGWWIAEKYEAATGDQPMLAAELSNPNMKLAHYNPSQAL
jgi:hypothetical protein